MPWICINLWLKLKIFEKYIRYMHITVSFSIYGFLVSVRGYGGNGTGKLGEGYYFRVPSISHRAFSNLLFSLLPVSPQPICIIVCTYHRLHCWHAWDHAQRVKNQDQQNGIAGKILATKAWWFGLIPFNPYKNPDAFFSVRWEAETGNSLRSLQIH